MPSNRPHSSIRKEAGPITESPRIHRPPSLPFDAQPEGTRETSSRFQDPSFTAFSRFWPALLVNWAHLSRIVQYTHTPRPGRIKEHHCFVHCSSPPLWARKEDHPGFLSPLPWIKTTSTPTTTSDRL
ncbi:hypothetical protein CaCOL14_004374 [Colletotrichum acutatum]